MSSLINHERKQKIYRLKLSLTFNEQEIGLTKSRAAFLYFYNMERLLSDR